MRLVSALPGDGLIHCRMESLSRVAYEPKYVVLIVLRYLSERFVRIDWLRKLPKGIEAVARLSDLMLGRHISLVLCSHIQPAFQASSSMLRPPGRSTDTGSSRSSMPLTGLQLLTSVVSCCEWSAFYV